MHWFRIQSGQICYTLWNIFMIHGRNVEQDETTCHVQEWQLWHSFFWSYLPLFCLKQISCPLCNSNALQNILMAHGRNVEQDETTYRVQEWQLCLSNFWRYLPLLYLSVIMYWFRVRSVSRFMMLSRNVDQDKTVVEEWQLWSSYFWSYLPLVWFWNRFRVRSVTRIPFGIFWWHLIKM